MRTDGMGERRRKGDVSSPHLFAPSLLSTYYKCDASLREEDTLDSQRSKCFSFLFLSLPVMAASSTVDRSGRREREGGFVLSPPFLGCSQSQRHCEMRGLRRGDSPDFPPEDIIVAAAAAERATPSVSLPNPL